MSAPKPIPGQIERIEHINRIEPIERRRGVAVGQLTGALKDAIAAGELRPGQRMPSIRQMVAKHALSYHTVASAYERLASSGFLSARQGRGYFVERLGALSHASNASNAAGAPRTPDTPAAPLDSSNPNTADNPDGTPGSANGTGSTSDASAPDDPATAFIALFHSRADGMKLGAGWLPPDWRDTDALARVIRRTASFAHSSLIEYGDPPGYLPLRQNLARHLHMKLGLALDARQILTTLGATQALDLVIRSTIAPGDRVLVDDPCNASLIQLLKLRGAHIAGVPRHANGPDIARLETLLQAGAYKAFFVNSLFHNPTGSSLDPRHACQILQLANQHDLLLIEDDVYGDFEATGTFGASGTFGAMPGNRLATLDGLRRTLYIGSFSKTLSANLRVGYVLAPPAVIASLARLKLLTSVAVPSFCERFVNAILDEGLYQRHLRGLQEKLGAQQALAQQVFQKWGWEIFHAPPGGLFLLVRHPRLPDTAGFIERARAAGIFLIPGRFFSVDGAPSPWLRINVSHLDAARAEPVFRLD